jgi:hypothetical protein
MVRWPYLRLHLRYICVTSRYITSRAPSVAVLEELLLLLFLLGEQAEFDGADGRLGAVGDLELADHALYIGLDGGEADPQVLGELPVRLTQGEQSQYLDLPLRKRFGERLFLALLDGFGERSPVPPVLNGQALEQSHGKFLV